MPACAGMTAVQGGAAGRPNAIGLQQRRQHDTSLYLPQRVDHNGTHQHNRVLLGGPPHTSEAKGASAEITSINSAQLGNLDRYGGVQAGTPRSRLGHLVPSPFISTFPIACRQHLADGEEAPLKGVGHPIRIDSEVMWYHKRKGLGVVTGAKSYAVMLVDLLASGRPLGRLQIVATSGASRTDAADMAEAMAEALAEWIRSRRNSSG